MYEQITNLVREEGLKLKDLAGKVPDNFKTKDWTTKHDHAIEQKILRLISSFGPTHQLLSEEQHRLPKDADDIWIADPISHTINFIRGIPHYAIVVSHLHNGEVNFGCVYDPSMDELFTAEKGKGAFLNNQPIQVQKSSSRTNILYNPYPLTDQNSWTIEETMDMYQKIHHLGYIDSLGSMGLQFAYVAAGRADLVVMANKDTFPLFAGKILVEEAGGIFTDFQNKPLTLTTRGVIAGTKQMHQKAYEALNKE